MCSPSKGWGARVAKFRAMPLSNQLKKVKLEDGVWKTHGIGAKRVMGIIDGHLRSYLEYKPTENGPRYRLALDENMGGSAWSNFHSAYKIELLVDGELIELTKAGQEDAYPVCGANNQCMTKMVSYYIIDPALFAKIEGMSEETLLPLRITRENSEYRPCRDFIAAAEFKLLRSAIDAIGK
jgi:hypothetical protein